MRLHGTKVPSRKELKSIACGDPRVCSQTGHLKIALWVTTDEGGKYSTAIVNPDIQRLRDLAKWIADPKGWKAGSVAHVEGGKPVLHLLGSNAPPDKSMNLGYKTIRGKHHLQFDLSVGHLAEDRIPPVPIGGLILPQ